MKISSIYDFICYRKILPLEMGKWVVLQWLAFKFVIWLCDPWLPSVISNEIEALKLVMLYYWYPFSFNFRKKKQRTCLWNSNSKHVQLAVDWILKWRSLECGLWYWTLQEVRSHHLSSKPIKVFLSHRPLKIVSVCLL